MRNAKLDQEAFACVTLQREKWFFTPLIILLYMLFFMFVIT